MLLVNMLLTIFLPSYEIESTTRDTADTARWMDYVDADSYLVITQITKIDGIFALILIH